MSLQPYELRLNDKTEGIIVVDTCTGMPLRIRRSAFEDIDDANEFLKWCGNAGVDIRHHYSPEELLDDWAPLRGAIECPWCRSALSLTIRRRFHRNGGGFAVHCRCGDFTDEDGDIVCGVGQLIWQSVDHWNSLAAAEAVRRETQESSDPQPVDCPRCGGHSLRCSHMPRKQYPPNCDEDRERRQ